MEIEKINIDGKFVEEPVCENVENHMRRVQPVCLTRELVRETARGQLAHFLGSLRWHNFELLR